MKRFPFIAGALVLIAVLDWIAFKRGWVPPHPEVFAALVSIVMVLLFIGACRSVSALSRKALRPIRALAGLAVSGGLLTLCAGGMANWLLSLQGAVILSEGESVPLSRQSRLQAFEAGLFADLEEMSLALRLDEVELVAEGGGFLPRSHLVLARGHSAPEAFAVAPRQARRVGPLWYRQGAFGFSPRIVVLKGKETLFDQAVPFLTRREGSLGTSFSGAFEIEKEGLSVEGDVSLESLDERMKGHAALRLRTLKGGNLLGEGRLLPGQFADLREGYRVGFAGLAKWSEIDIARRNYPLPIFIGGGVFLLGLLLWPAAVWRKW